MRKGASRNMQRIGLKVTAGIAPQESGNRPAPFYKQLHAMEMRRLDRIRYGFELEQQIQSKLDAGESVGLLRERLQGVRNGSVEPPRYRDAKITGRRPVEHVQLEHLRQAKPERSSRRPLYASERQAVADLGDLARGKLTLTGIATVKGLLERFDAEFVAGALKVTPEFLGKVTSSAAYALATAMSAADGLILAGVLEKRAESVAPPGEEVEAPPAPPLEANGSRKYISVDAITGNQFLKLRDAGWTLSFDRMYPPADWKQDDGDEIEAHGMRP